MITGLLMILLMVAVFFATGIIQFIFSVLGYIFQWLLILIFMAIFAIAIYSMIRKMTFKSAYNTICEKLKEDSEHECYHTTEDCENCRDASKCEQKDKEYEFMQDGMK